MTVSTKFSTGIDRETGAPLFDFDHAVQSMATIFSTRFGERVMREWVGSPVVYLLGKNLNAPEVIDFFAAVAATIDAFEPRFKVRKVEPLSVARLGRFGVRVVVEYRPRGHLGDLTAERSLRAINATYDQGRWNTQGEEV